MLEAAERAAAIQICNSHPGPIHLLLTDLTMPGINGRELARRVKCHAAEDERALYVRLYRECQRTQCISEEGIALLQKPFSLSTLKIKVSEKLSTASRAQGFNLQLPLKYRLLGESAWRNGATENISRSGMLFPVEESIQLNAQLEINLVLPAETAGLSPAAVICHGEVVRTVELEQPIVGPALACDTSSPGHSSGQDNHPRQPTTLFSELSESPQDYLAILRACDFVRAFVCRAGL